MVVAQVVVVCAEATSTASRPRRHNREAREVAQRVRQHLLHAVQALVTIHARQMALAKVPPHLLNTTLKVSHYCLSLIWLQIVRVARILQSRLVLRVLVQVILSIKQLFARHPRFLL